MVVLFMVCMTLPSHANAPDDVKNCSRLHPRRKIPKGAKHDCNLGPTGLRGWIYCDKLVTTDARQILVTKVAKASPAADAFPGRRCNPRGRRKAVLLRPAHRAGKSNHVAESKAGEGKLALTRWRAGKSTRSCSSCQYLAVTRDSSLRL